MLNRVVKTILILSICLGITLPSNASSTKVSDGSVFITKAEFSSKLNDLSNRLSHLENSIDSKINSLVSSYLTRNGIWNGAKQPVLNNLGTTPSSNESMRVFDKVTKSGLMLVTYYLNINYAVGAYGISNNKSEWSIGRANGSPVVHTIGITTGLYNVATNDWYQKADLVYVLCGEYDTGNAMGYAVKLNTSPSGLFSFFVKKDDDINYSLSTSIDIRMDWWALTRSTITGNTKTLTGDCFNINGVRAGFITGSNYAFKFGIEGTDVEVW